jgi:uncharacterized protein YukE
MGNTGSRNKVHPIPGFSRDVATLAVRLPPGWTGFVNYHDWDDRRCYITNANGKQFKKQVDHRALRWSVQEFVDELFGKNVGPDNSGGNNLDGSSSDGSGSGSGKSGGGNSGTGAGVLVTTTIISIVGFLALLCGASKETDKGNEVEAGSEQFRKLSGQLEAALAGDSWQGEASQAYDDQVHKLQNLAQQMADLDLELAAAVKDQADQVDTGRSVLETILDSLYEAQDIVKLIEAIPYGEPVAIAYAIGVALPAISAATATVNAVDHQSRLNAQKINELTSRYQEVAAQALPTDTLARIEVRAAVESTAPSFEAIASSMPGRPDMAGMAGLAGVASGLEDLRASLLSAFTGQGESPGLKTAPLPIPEAPLPIPEPEPEKPKMPKLPEMPTLAELTQMSAQAAKLSGHLSQHLNLVNQSMGQAQQGQGAAAPAEEPAPEEATLDDAALEKVEGKGAAVGTEAGRACTY